MRKSWKSLVLKARDVRADSGFSDGNAQIFLAEILPTADISLSEEEGIGGFQWGCEERFREMIRNGDITDGFTLSAYAQLLCTDKS